jgi:lipopolysaccharide biosynthesis regulator YciM
VEQVGVQIEESTGRSGPAAAVPLDDSAFADFAVTGARVSGEFRCADCGYGAVVQRLLPPCPMCAGTVWESRGPLARTPVD